MVECGHNLVHLLKPDDTSRGQCVTCEEIVELTSVYKPHAHYRYEHNGDGRALSPFYERVVRDNPYFVMARKGTDMDVLKEVLGGYGEIERMHEELNAIWLNCTKDEASRLVADFEGRSKDSPLYAIAVLKEKKEDS
jgi:hypothetical protein